MPRHTVVLDDTFVENLGDLDSVIQKQIGVVWSGLEEDAFFIPSEDQYTTEPREGKGNRPEYIACQHNSGWLGWSLVWFWEYFDVAESTVEFVVLRLEHLSPPVRLEPRLPN